MPGRFAETLDSCRLRRQLRHFFLGKNSDLGAGSAGLRCRAGGAAGMWRARYRSLHVGGLARLPGRNVMLESISGTYAFEAAGWEAPMLGRRGRVAQYDRHGVGFFASELETGTNHFLVAARVEFGTGNRHHPFFGRCPRGSSAWSSPPSWGDNRIEGGKPGVTTGLRTLG